jgi:hypothetical protein
LEQRARRGAAAQWWWAAVAAAVVEVFLGRVDNQVAKVDVAVVGNNPTRTGKATMEV